MSFPYATAGDDELSAFIDDASSGEEEEFAVQREPMPPPLVHMDEAEIDELSQELEYRLRSGLASEFVYEVGVLRDGTPVGLTQEELDMALENLQKAANRVQSKVALPPVQVRQLPNDKLVADVLIRELNPDRYIDIRLAVSGNVDAGKSTLIGVLTRGRLDDGRGLVRQEVFQHKHESSTGRTSSISQQILGFNVDGECVNYTLSDKRAAQSSSWVDIVAGSYKVVSFIDLAGHERYLKTTIAGFTGQMPDYCCLLVGANMGVTKMTKEHLGLALALKLPIIVLVTKVDIAPQHILEQTLNDITRILKSRGVRKTAYPVKTDDDILKAIRSFNTDRIVPLFQLSSVTGMNLDLLRKFLNLLPLRLQWKTLEDQPAEVLVDQSFYITGVGTVVAGTCMAGKVTQGQTLLLGPDGNGKFIPIQIKSKRVPQDVVVAGQNISLALKKVKRSYIRRGMVLVDESLNPQASWFFEAEVIILYHSTTVQPGYQPVIQCLNVRQSAKIVEIKDREVLRTGDRAVVRFKFMYRPEYLKIGMRLVIREGQCKGIGVLSSVFPDEGEGSKPAPPSSSTRK